MSTSKGIVERRVKLLNGLSGSDDRAKRIRYAMYSRYGDLAEALYKDPVKEGLIRGNPNTFGVLTDKTVFVWAYTNKKKYAEFAEACKKYPELEILFSNAGELQKGINKILSIVKKDYSDITYEAFLKSLTEFNPDNIVPLEDDMEDIEIDENGFFMEEEEQEQVKQEKEKEKQEQAVGYVNNDYIDPAVIDRQIKETLEELSRGDLEPEVEEALRVLLADLKELKQRSESGNVEALEVKDEYANDITDGISILKEIGANFAFTRRELYALDKAFKSVGYDFKADKELAKHNFVAVKRSDFSATFIFSTLGLLPDRRKKIMDVFLAYTGYSAFGEIDETPYGRQDWWSFDCITNYRKFTIAEWPGTLLVDYKDLGNLRKMWVGSSLKDKYVTVDFLEPQNSFNLIGGKSRSGKTCLSHAMTIQAICGGVLPTYLDWKPEGSELYRQLGFYVVQRDAKAWLPQGINSGQHLLNILDALAWLKSMSIVWSRRELAGKRDFDRNKLATPDDPSLLFIFDEIAAFINSLDSIRPNKREKDMTPQDKACVAVTELAEKVFKELNACLAACATYGIKFMGITQDIMISDTVWTSKAWGGDEGRNFRKKMLNTFWGRGTVRGSDCPIVDKRERTYVNMGKGRFGIEVNGEPIVFRALRIDNTPDPNSPELTASEILQNCLSRLGRELPVNRYSYFEELMNLVHSMPEFSSVRQQIIEAYSGVGIESQQGNIYAPEGWGDEVVKADNVKVEITDESIELGEVQSNFDELTKGLQGTKVEMNSQLESQLEAERLSREALERSEGLNADDIEVSDEALNELEEAIKSKLEDKAEGLAVDKQDLRDLLSILVEYRGSKVLQHTGSQGRNIILDSSQYKDYTKLSRESYIDCRDVGRGRISLMEKIWMNTPSGAEKYINSLWNSILDGIISKGFKRPNITRVSIYGGQMYVNGKIVNLNGVIGGYEDIRLRDIVSFKTLFRKFFMIRELRIDEDMLRVALVELGDNPIQKFFELGNKLEIVYIQKSNGEIVSFDRTSVMNKKASEMIQKGKLKNDFDLYCMARSKNRWSENRMGDNIWGLRLAKNGLTAASKMFMDKNKPSVGRAAVITGISLVIGTVGPVLWGATQLVRGISEITGMLRNK